MNTRVRPPLPRPSGAVLPATITAASGWQEAAGTICLLFPADRECFLVSSYVLAECHNLIVGNKSRKY